MPTLTLNPSKLTMFLPCAGPSDQPVLAPKMEEAHPGAPPIHNGYSPQVDMADLLNLGSQEQQKSVDKIFDPFSGPSQPAASNDPTTAAVLIDLEQASMETPKDIQDASTASITSQSTPSQNMDPFDPLNNSNTGADGAGLSSVDLIQGLGSDTSNNGASTNPFAPSSINPFADSSSAVTHEVEQTNPFIDPPQAQNLVQVCPEVFGAPPPTESDLVPGQPDLVSLAGPVSQPPVQPPLQAGVQPPIVPFEVLKHLGGPAGPPAMAPIAPKPAPPAANTPTLAPVKVEIVTKEEPDSESTRITTKTTTTTSGEGGGKTVTKATKVVTKQTVINDKPGEAKKPAETKLFTKVEKDETVIKRDNKSSPAAKPTSATSPRPKTASKETTTTKPLSARSSAPAKSVQSPRGKLGEAIKKPAISSPRTRSAPPPANTKIPVSPEKEKKGAYYLLACVRHHLLGYQHPTPYSYRHFSYTHI